MRYEVTVRIGMVQEYSLWAEIPVEACDKAGAKAAVEAMLRELESSRPWAAEETQIGKLLRNQGYNITDRLDYEQSEIESFGGEVEGCELP